MTDHELHSLALAHIASRGGSYVDAVHAVRLRTQYSESAPGAGLAGSGETAATGPTDAQLHEQAMRHVARSGCTYAEAIHQAATQFKCGGARVSFSEGPLSPAPFDKPVALLAVGQSQTDGAGTKTLTLNDLNQIAAAYDPAKHEAPLAAGEIRDTSPAYGWVRSLVVQNGQLFMQAGDVNPDFAAMVNAREFPTRTVSLYPPAAPQNPTPGQWSLRSVAYAGADAKKVAALRPTALRS